jgi:flagellar motor switch protein FliM
MADGRKHVSGVRNAFEGTAQRPDLAWATPSLLRCAKAVAEALRRSVGRDVAAQAGDLRVEEFGAVLAGYAEGDLCHVARIEGWRAPALLVLPQAALGVVTEALLGGMERGRSELPDHPVSGDAPVTKRLARRVVVTVIEAFENAFAELYPGRVRLTRQESDPRLAGIMSDADLAVVWPLALTFAGRAASVTVILPEAALVEASRLAESA